jgi:hypothetical protein
MYHDTIHITFSSSDSTSNLGFYYDFLISKSNSWLNVWQKYNNSPKEKHITSYKDILSKFKEIGFNVEYLMFPDAEDDVEVYCAYNYLVSKGGYEVFFKAYNKVLKKQPFDISFEYGTMINGTFHPNCINSCAIVKFISPSHKSRKGYFNAAASSLLKRVNVISDLPFSKLYETYTIVDINGKKIYTLEVYDDFDEKKKEFFSNQKVAVYLRKYKLMELMYKN